MKLKLFAVALIAIFVISAAAMAQNAQGTFGGKRHNQPIMRQVIKELGLTQDQISQIKPMLKQFRTDVKGVHESNLPKDQKIAKIKDLRKQLKSSIMSVLTPEQQRKAPAVWAKARRKMAAMRMQWMAKKLGLTADQKANIKSITQDARQQAKAIRTDTTLSKDAKKAKLQELRKDTRAKVMNVLTPEQRQEMKTLRQAHKTA